MRLLSESDVAALLDPELAITAVEGALRAYSAHEAVQPLRSVLRVASHSSLLGLMPAFLPATNTLGLKSVAVVPGNAERKLPTHQAMILLTDPATGAPRALLDGRLITEVRTAAASALATRVLSRADSRVLAILGAGVQAHSHLEAIRRVRALTEVRVWSRTPESRNRFVRAVTPALGIPIRACSEAKQAVKGADLIVTATASATPVLQGEWIAPGSHLNAIGACTPRARELAGAAVARCRVWVDSTESAVAESGDLILASAEGALRDEALVGELGSLLLGHIPGRASSGEITLFKSLGIGVEDLATAEAVLQRAEARGVGTEYDLTK